MDGQNRVNSEHSDVKILYRNLCPNCGGDIFSTDLAAGLFCQNCQKHGKILFFKEHLQRVEEKQNFENYFYQKTGKKLNAFQNYWARKALLGDSFALSAPTGMGKTTFVLHYILYKLERKKFQKIYILVPTRALAKQIVSFLSSFVSCASYFGKPAEKEQIKSGDFTVLVTTTNFFYKNFPLVAQHRYDFIFVDDVDSFLKSSRRTSLLFRLIGFTDEEIAKKEGGKRIPVQVIISSATVRPSGQKLQLFRSLLGFDVGRFQSSVNRIFHLVRAINKGEQLNWIIRLCRQLHNGIFLFLPQGMEEGYIERLIALLNQSGIKTAHYKEFLKKFEQFQTGEIQVFVGIAHLYNPLVRGIDSPHIKYALFLEPPHYQYRLSMVDHPAAFLMILRTLQYKADLSDELKQKIHYFLRLSYWTKERIAQLRQLVFQLLEEESHRAYLNGNALFTISRVEDDYRICIPDILSYVQAAGRTSRFSSIGIYHGCSIILHSDPTLFSAFERKMKIYDETVSFDKLRLTNLRSIKNTIEQEREKVKKGVFVEENLQLRSVLLLVESPTKAKTIARFYGNPQMSIRDGCVFYEVVTPTMILTTSATLGHIFDLSSTAGVWGVIPQEWIPVYESIRICRNCGEQVENGTVCSFCNAKNIHDKMGIIKTLSERIIEYDEVYIGTDPDTEGEKIAYDLYCALRPYCRKMKRMEFHEVTRKAIEQAFANPRGILMNRVAGQLLRRIYDRWIGFFLSQFLQRHYRRKNLSAGRVQTPVLGWIVHRTAQLRQRQYRVFLQAFSLLLTVDLQSKADVQRFEQEFSPRLFTAEKIEKELLPPPPYNTESVLQDANRILKFSAAKTMNVLQLLFENGFITYHRTDSIHVSAVGQGIAKIFISRYFHEDLFVPRRWEEEGTHEAIRITKPVDEAEVELVLKNRGFSFEEIKDALRLYRIIFRRFLASQMKAARVQILQICFHWDDYKKCWEFPTRILEPGFTLIAPIHLYYPSQDGAFKILRIREVPKFFPYTEAELVHDMKENRIGRPSTYAVIIETLKKRKYVRSTNAHLVASRLGTQVFHFLQKSFPQYTAVDLTRELEAKITLVEENGKLIPEIQALYQLLFEEGVGKKYEISGNTN